MFRNLAIPLGIALLVVVIDAGAAHAESREDGSIFRRWVVEQTTVRPATARTITVSVRDQTGWRASTRWGREHRYNVSAKLGGEWYRRVGADVTFTIRADQKLVPIRVRDRQGAQYDTILEVGPREAETLLLTSTWSPAVHRGRFVNSTHKCGRRGRRVWRLGVQVEGDLQIGESVKIRPGRSEIGPMLPDGTYKVAVEMWRRGAWQGRPTQQLTVAGDRWRFDPGCDVFVSKASAPTP